MACQTFRSGLLTVGAWRGLVGLLSHSVTQTHHASLYQISWRKGCASEREGKEAEKLTAQLAVT